MAPGGRRSSRCVPASTLKHALGDELAMLVKVVPVQGCSLHHSGHLTLWGVRVAFTMVR
jgi:hypothetical protein